MKNSILTISEARLIYYWEKLYVSVFLFGKSLIIKKILFITFNTRILFVELHKKKIKIPPLKIKNKNFVLLKIKVPVLVC